MSGAAPAFLRMAPACSSPRPQRRSFPRLPSAWPSAPASAWAPRWRCRTLPSRSRPMSATTPRSRAALSPSARSPPSRRPATPPMRRRSRPAAACSMASRPPIRRRPKIATVSAYGGWRASTLPSANVTIAAENVTAQGRDGDATASRSVTSAPAQPLLQTSSDAHTAAYLGAGRDPRSHRISRRPSIYRDQQRQQQRASSTSGLEARSSPAPRAGVAFHQHHQHHDRDPLRQQVPRIPSISAVWASYRQRLPPTIRTMLAPPVKLPLSGRLAAAGPIRWSRTSPPRWAPI